MRNIKLTVAYDGTAYHGFQTQAKLPTIQETIEGAISKLAKTAIKLQGAGRTDAGVHARGQVVNFRTEINIPLDKWPLAVNSILPEDIVVLKAEEVAEEFHARFDAKGKTYTYQIYSSPIASPFYRNYAWHVPVKLDAAAMDEAAQVLIGKHDFSSFQAADTRYRDPVKTLLKAEVKGEGPLVTVTLTGDGFLYNMVRIITGTLVQVGQGKLIKADLSDILEARSRTKAGATAPPQGLFMQEVYY